MTPTTMTSSSTHAVTALLDPERVRDLLISALPFEALGSGLPEDIRIERFWPGRSGGYTFEWSFKLGAGSRCVLFARTPSTGSVEDGVGIGDRSCLTITPAGLRGVFLDLPSQDLVIHSPDCDPLLPQVGSCLDSKEMATRLVPVLVRAGRHSHWLDREIRCELVAYRPGRRAALRYTPTGSTGALAGKTYRDGRGERLLQLHEHINHELAWYSAGRVRVPAPFAYVPELDLALFSWAPGNGPGIAADLATDAEAGIDALTALHRVSLQDGPSFTIANELDIVRRWSRAWRPGGGSSDGLSEALVDGLRLAAEAVPETPPSTIHRDFYEAQWLRTARTTTVLDLDTLARGDACVDVGNLLAHLVLRMLRLSGSTEGFTELGERLVQRYVQHRGGLEAASLRFYLASALFRLGAVHALRTETGRFSSELWTLADKVLAGEVSRLFRVAS